MQNLIALRFGNSLFEPLWSARHTSGQFAVTVGETVGVEGRGDYYDESGAVRDMLQKPSACSYSAWWRWGPLHALTPRRCATKDQGAALIARLIDGRNVGHRIGDRPVHRRRQ